MGAVARMEAAVRMEAAAHMEAVVHTEVVVHTEAVVHTTAAHTEDSGEEGLHILGLHILVLRIPARRTVEEEEVPGGPIVRARAHRNLEVGLGDGRRSHRIGTAVEERCARLGRGLVASSRRQKNHTKGFGRIRRTRCWEARACLIGIPRKGRRPCPPWH